MKQGPYIHFINKSKSTLILKNQTGQALVEYLLMLIIIVSILLSFRGIFSSMNNFMSDFMGGYVVCLMEYGELPSLGVENDDLKKHKSGSGKKCEYRKFSSESIAGLGGGGNGNGANSGKNSANGQNSSSANKNKSASDNQDDSRSGGRSGSSGSPGSSSKSTSTRSSNSFGKADAPSDLANSKIKTIDEKSDSEKSGNRNRSGIPYEVARSGSNSNSKYKAITGGLAEQIEKNSKKGSRAPSSYSKPVSEDGYRFKPYKKIFNPPTVNKPIEEAPEDSFTVGNILKWIIIAGILIACFILFGGQILSYSNSSDN